MSLEQADRPITDVMALFSSFWLDVGLLVPTPTGLDKSIMDAHSSLRAFLKLKGLHDYDTQGQGPLHKRYLTTWLVDRSGTRETKTSLYRPETKSGDPRIYIYGLAQFAKAGNVLALVAHEGELYVFNGSDVSFMETASTPASHLAALLQRLSPQMTPVANELLQKLRGISDEGYIPTMRPGPTGVGYTLESLLGIRANSKKAPDFKGIELKASRTRESGRASTRVTLFSKTPDWKAGKYNALRLLQTYGRPDEDGRVQIYCTLGNSPNPTFGFYLATEAETLHSLRGVPNGLRSASDEKILQWGLPALRSILLDKHRETFWVKARTRGAGANEAFHYYEVAHTQAPLQANFAPLIDSGHIQLDFVMHLRAGKRGPVPRDHGYLFKLWERDQGLLFPEPRRYSLA